MMCGPCQMGGYYNEYGAWQGADAAHAACEYPMTCTCQHRVGPEKWHD